MRSACLAAARRRTPCGLQARAGVGLGEQHVEADHGGTLICEQLVGQRGELVKVARPAADLGEASLVDLDDARTECARHEGTQARVGNRQIERGDEAQRLPTGGVSDRGQSRGWVQACTNCICVPASSITSPFFRCTVSPTTGLPLTVGCSAPSTWAST